MFHVGMIAGIALYLKGVNPKIRIVGVQADSVAPLENFKQTDELKCGPGIHMFSSHARSYPFFYLSAVFYRVAIHGSCAGLSTLRPLL